MVTLQLTDRSFDSLVVLLDTLDIVEGISSFTDVYPLMIREELSDFHSSIDSIRDSVVSTD